MDLEYSEGNKACYYDTIHSSYSQLGQTSNRNEIYI
jgi:hypothetical protein